MGFKSRITFASHNDRLLPTDHQALQHNWDLVDTGEVRQVVDVLMGVDEAVLHLHHFVVSLLCTLPNIEEEEASCLAGVVEVDVHNHDGEVGEHKSLRTEPQPGDEWDYFGRIMVIIYLNLESRICMNTNMKKSKSGHMSTRSALSDCLFETFLYF